MAISNRVSVDECNLPDSTPIPTKLVTALSSEFDSINVAKMSKGQLQTATALGLSGMTATTTSNEIDCREFNGLEIDFGIAGTGKWEVEITGCSISGGTFKSVYLGRSSTPLKRSNLTANSIFSFPITSNYTKIVATEITNGATVTINATPCVLATVPETDPRQCRWEPAVILAATNSYSGAVADLANDSAYDYTDDVDLESIGSRGMAVTLEYDSSGTTDNIVFSIFGSLDGTNFDDTELYSMTCTATSGADTQISFQLPSCPPHLRFGVKTTGTTNTFDYRIVYRLFK
jgi:hypothetical protein